MIGEAAASIAQVEVEFLQAGFSAAAAQILPDSGTLRDAGWRPSEPAADVTGAYEFVRIDSPIRLVIRGPSIGSRIGADAGFPAATASALAALQTVCKSLGLQPSGQCQVTLSTGINGSARRSRDKIMALFPFRGNPNDRVSVTLDGAGDAGSLSCTIDGPNLCVQSRAGSTIAPGADLKALVTTLCGRAGNALTDAVDGLASIDETITYSENEMAIARLLSNDRYNFVADSEP